MNNRNFFIAACGLMLVWAASGISFAQVDAPSVSMTVAPKVVNVAGSGGEEVFTITKTIKGAGDTSSVPLDVVFALDSSGSMNTNDPDDERIKAAKTFLGLMDMDSGTDQAGVVSWNSAIDFSLPLTDDSTAVNEDLDKVGSGGGTNLDVGLEAALDLLPGTPIPERKCVIIFLTDGDGTYTPSGSPDSQADRAAGMHCAIYGIGLDGMEAGIGFDMGFDMEPLEDMAEATGGQAYLVDAADLKDLFQQIYQQISSVPYNITVQETVQDYIELISCEPVADESPADGTVIWYDIDDGKGLPEEEESVTLTCKAKCSEKGVKKPIDILAESYVAYTDKDGGNPETVGIPQAFITCNSKPEARCQDVTLNLEANGQAVLSSSQVDNGSSDPDGDPITFSLSKTNFSCSDIGTKHAITLTVTDDGNASDSCIANVTVVDNLAPVPNVNPLPQVTGECSATVSSAPKAHDNCAGTVTGSTGDPLSYSTQGTYTVTWTFDDGKGNTSTQPQQVVVQDTVAPTVVTKNITVELDENGNASISVDDIDNGSTDNCCIASRTIDKSSFTCSDAGGNTVTLTVKDCNGNSSTATATVTVEDNIAPVVKTKNVTVELDADGNASITADDIDNGSSDNCGIASLALDRTEFTCSDLDENTVTLTVTDNNGNVADETATVTVLPYTVPVSTTGVITDKPTSSYRDVAIFKITGVTDIGTVAMDAAAAGTAVTFEFRTADEGRLYSFTADSFDAAGNRMIYSDTEGNMVRCIFSTERCVVRMRYVDFDGDTLDASLPEDMTVNLQVGCTQYSNTGYWQQYDSGSGTWTKYRKDS